MVDQDKSLSEFMKEDGESSENYLRLRRTFDEAVSAAPTVNPTSSNFLGYAEAFLIFAKYAGSVKWQNFSAEHDEVWSGPEDASVVSAEDLARLEELGWYVDEEYGGFRAFV